MQSTVLVTPNVDDVLFTVQKEKKRKLLHQQNNAKSFMCCFFLNSLSSFGYQFVLQKPEHYATKRLFPFIEVNSITSPSGEIVFNKKEIVQKCVVNGVNDKKLVSLVQNQTLFTLMRLLEKEGTFYTFDSIYRSDVTPFFLSTETQHNIETLGKELYNHYYEMLTYDDSNII
ncbi:Uncharacterized protein QTN25_008183 [Entamoeba marina]